MKSQKKTGIVIFCWIFLIAWLGIWIYKYPIVKLKAYEIDGRQNPGSVRCEIQNGDIISQTFSAKQKFDGVTIYIDTVNVSETHDIAVELVDNKQKIVREWSIPSGIDVGDGYWLRLHEQVGRGDYSLSIKADSLTGNEAAYVYSDPVIYQGTSGLVKNENISSDTLKFSVFKTRINLFFVISAISFLLTAVILTIGEKRFGRFFVPLMVFFLGISYMCATSPFIHPDDDYHYNSALYMSSIILGQNDVQYIEEEYFRPDKFNLYSSDNDAFVRMNNELLTVQATSIDKKMYCHNRSDRLKHPIVYLFSALGISIGRLLGLNFTWTYYLGIVFNLLFYSLMTGVAAWNCHKMRTGILIISTLPAAIHQATSVSYDVVMNAMVLVFVAYVLKVAEEERDVTWKDTGILILISAIFVPVKIIYGIFLLILFAIPCKRYKGAIDYCLKNGSIFLVSGIASIISRFSVLNYEFGIAAANINTAQKSVGGTDIVLHAEKYGLVDVLKNPVGMVWIMINTLKVESVKWFKDAFGSSLGAFSIGINNKFIYSFILLLVFCVFLEAYHIKALGWRLRILSITASLGMIFLMMLAMVTWTTYGSNVIEGVQGRYFIPLIPIVCLAAFRIHIKKPEWLDAGMLLIPAGLLHAGVLLNIFAQLKR